MERKTGSEFKMSEKVAEHPLHNTLVLATIFRYDLAPKSILRNRLVSPTWLEACAGSWKKLRKCLVLQHSSSEGPGSLMTLAEFYALYEAGDPVVVEMMEGTLSSGKVFLHRWQYSEQMLRCLSLDHWFWTSPVVVTGLRQLTLVDCEFQKEVWVFKEHFLKMVPVLEQLTLKKCRVNMKTLEDINRDNQHWMEYEHRANGLSTRKRVPALANYYKNAKYFENGYQHEHLLSLDIDLTLVCPGNSGVQPSMQAWGPLLAQLPNLSSLRIRNYAQTVEPQFQLRRGGGDDDEVLNALKARKSCLIEKISIYRRSWMGISTEGEVPPPTRIGYFWELFWNYEIGQVARTLQVLDLLDFSGRAQDYGVLSTCEVAAKEKTSCGKGFSYFFPQLCKVSLDLGVDPRFALWDLTTLERWAQNSKELTLYRAPFSDIGPFENICIGTRPTSLELWGNLMVSFEPLRLCSYIQKLVWRTSCYEDKYHGKRVHHMIKSGKRAFPVWEQDFVANSDWAKIEVFWFLGFSRLTQLEMDWGPLSLQSWRKLGSHMPNLRWLKGVIVEDSQLAEVATQWAELEVLEMAHRQTSGITLEGMISSLTALRNLKRFTWKQCACTNKIFEYSKNLDETGKQLRNQVCPTTVLELPWEFPQKDADDTRNSSAAKKENKHSYCIQAEYEQALVSGESNKFFRLLSKLKQN